jgi:phosphoribosyl 1,2-cyclic phosphate phosphodiesterase
MHDSDLTITVLGSGTSHGIPMIACDCPVCRSTDPKDRRMRTSVTIQREDATLLIDTSPELRLQCVANNIRRVDAVLFTHKHVDHLAGLDDLRRFNWVQGEVLPCYGSAATLDRLRAMFSYAFENDPDYPSAKPELTLHEVDGPFDVRARQSTVRVTPIPLLHGTLPVLGFRVGNFAYCTDVNEIPAASWALLEGLDVLMLDAVRKKPHVTHFNLEQAVDQAHRIGAKQTFFTHIAHAIGHTETNRELPDGMALAYDGQVIRST